MEKYFWSFLGREGVLRKFSYEMFGFDKIKKNLV